MIYIRQFWQTLPDYRSLETNRSETLPYKGDRIRLGDRDYIVTGATFLDTIGEIRVYRIWVILVA